MMKLPQGRWFVTAIIMALLVGYYFCLFRPNKAEIARLHTELAHLSHETSDAQGKIARVHSMRAAVDQSQDYLDEWKARLPKAADIGVVYGEISRIAEEAAVKTTRFTPGAAEDLASIRQIPLEMDCRGDMTQIWELLHKLEQMENVVWVEKLEIQAGEGKSGELKCELSLVVFTGRAEISG